MSYILDALAKADAERRHPGDAATPHGAPSPCPPSGHKRVWQLRWWITGACLLGAALTAGAWLQRQASEPEPSRVEPVAVAMPPTPTPLDNGPPPLAAPEAPLLETAPRPEPAASPRIAAAPPEDPLPILSPAARIAAAIPSAPARPVAARPTSSHEAAAPPPRPEAPAQAQGVASTPAPPPLASGAPANAPALAISGATYSDNPAHRLLIVNGKVVQEGQEVAPGVRLEAIGPRSAVFNQGGTRFNINHQ